VASRRTSPTSTIERPEGTERLRVEADAMLDAGLRAVLVDYGEVHVLGSYALDLMAWRDLDIHIVRPTLDVARHFELGARLATLLGAAKMNFRDHRSGADSSVPPGLYWGVYLGDERRGAWKLDVWVVEPRHFEPLRDHASRLLARLSPPAREAILAIKGAVWHHPEYRRSFSSRDVYDAVLEHGVTDLRGFWKFLHDRTAAV
jgi:hypothetical protein